MRLKYLLVSFLLFALFESCVSSKQRIYLQEDGEALVTDNATITALSKPYKVQVNDILYINIKASDPELVAVFSNTNNEGNAGASVNPGDLYFNGYTVDVHGNIRIPVLGEINVLGYTADDIRKTIETKLLTEQLKESANLFVTVKLAGLNYSVIGEVNSPGQNTLFQEKATILEAIANAGDITEIGNRKDVIVIRQYPDGKKIHHVDLTNKKLLESPYFYIVPNDQIYVKPLKNKFFGVGNNGLQTVTTLLSAVSIVATTILLFRSF